MAVAVLLVSLYSISWTFRHFVRAVATGGSIVRIGGGVERLVVAENPSLIADYYAAEGRRPLIILVHGSSRQARKSGFVRLMANRLQAEGFPVMALDLEGFGESEDPKLAPGDSFRFENNVLTAAEFARARGLAPEGRIVYFGHSLGAGVVLRAGRLVPRPAAIVASGPPFIRRKFERGGESTRRSFSAGRLRDMEIPVEGITLAAMENYLEEMDPLTQLERGGHPPILFMFGQDTRVLPFAREHLPLEGTRHRLFVIKGAPHGYHIIGGRWGLVFFVEKVLDSVTHAVGGWALEWSGHRGRQDAVFVFPGSFMKPSLRFFDKRRRPWTRRFSN